MAYHIVENNSSTWATTSIKVGDFFIVIFFITNQELSVRTDFYLECDKDAYVYTIILFG